MRRSILRKRYGRSDGPTWVPPAMARAGMSPTMLDILLGKRKLPRPGDSVVYDRAYSALAQGGVIHWPRDIHHPGSLSDSYVITDKGLDLLREYRVHLRKLAGHPHPDAKKGGH